MDGFSAFNPHEFTEARVRTVATGRDHALEEILRVVRGNLGSKTFQHLIVSAPRGFGKSFLMRHTQFEIERIRRDEGLPIRVVLMPEEMPHVKEPETLITEITRTLIGGPASSAELTWHEDEGELWEAAVEALQNAIREQAGEDGLLVALVENFDQLLERAFSKDVQKGRLRALLTSSDNRLMLVAASASGAFDRDYDAVLFQAFKELSLEPWTVEECLAFFDRQQEDAGKPPLAGVDLARAKAVANFIGGVPRLAALLGDSLFSEDVLGAADLLERLVDELTPYYKERIDGLPGRSQKLLDALLRGGEPATQSELAHRVQANSQSAIAGAFSQLRAEQIVTSTKAPGSAEVLYRVADRVFAHYYRRRIIDHGKSGCALEALVDLLAEYFSPDERRAKAAEFAQLGHHREASVLARLGGARGQGGQGDLDTVMQWFVPRRIQPLASPELMSVLDEISSILRKDNLDIVHTLLSQADQKLESSGDHVLLNLFRSALQDFEGIASGLAAAEDAVTIAETTADKRFATVALCNLGWRLARAGRPAEALVSLETSLGMARETGNDMEALPALRSLSQIYGSLGRSSEAITAARAGVALSLKFDEREQASTLRFLSGELNRSGDIGGSIEAAQKALLLAEAVGDSYQVMCAHLNIANGQLKADQEGIALASVVIARGLATEGDYPNELLDAVTLNAYAFAGLGRPDEALAEVEVGMAMAVRLGSKEYQSDIASLGSRVLATLARNDEAVAMAREGLALAGALGNVELEGRAAGDLVLCLGDVGAHADALTVIKEVTGRSDSEGLLRTPLAADCAWLGRQLALDLSADLETLHAALRVAASLPNEGAAHGCLKAWLEGFVGTVVLRIGDPDQLDALVAAIRLHFGDRMDSLIAPLSGGARYHRFGRESNEAMRIDPDLRRSLDIIFGTKRETKASNKRKGDA